MLKKVQYGSKAKTIYPTHYMYMYVIGYNKNHKSKTTVKPQKQISFLIAFKSPLLILVSPIHHSVLSTMLSACRVMPKIHGHRKH